ncbi:hypothetical protein [Actinopolymorpha sp. B9G3]|uniref:hypothetical protein n=1 Tax=Actinopolymorpha sp. B9G3 TaxID=3158970 RepID=UPI0032D8BAC3
MGGPAGGRFQNLGIHPDILVAPTPEGIAAGRDDVLEAAIAALRQSRLDVRP